MSKAPAKICLITSKHPIRDSRIYGCFYKGIASAGGDVMIIGPYTDENDHAEDIRSICLPVPCTANQATMHSVRLIWERLVALVHLLRWCLRLRPDIIQANEPDSWAVAWLAGRLCRGRVVFDVHEMFPAYIARHLPARIRQRGEAWLLGIFRWFFQRADAVFHVSEERRAYYAAPDNNQFVVPSYPPLAIADIPAVAEDREPVDFVHLGKVVEPVCRWALVRALARCRAAGRSCTVTIIGQSYAEFSDGLSADELAAIDHQLRCLASLPHRQALEMAAAARVGLVLYDEHTASRNIVASRKLFEYMALGLPVLGTRVVGAFELIERHSLGLVVPLDAEALAEAMLRLLGDPGLRKRCAAAGRTAFVQHYNWEAHNTRLMSQYAQLATQHERSR